VASLSTLETRSQSSSAEEELAPQEEITANEAQVKWEQIKPKKPNTWLNMITILLMDQVGGIVLSIGSMQHNINNKKYFQLYTMILWLRNRSINGYGALGSIPKN